MRRRVKEAKSLKLNGNPKKRKNKKDKGKNYVRKQRVKRSK